MASKTAALDVHNYKLERGVFVPAGTSTKGMICRVQQGKGTAMSLFLESPQLLAEVVAVQTFCASSSCMGQVPPSVKAAYDHIRRFMESLGKDLRRMKAVPTTIDQAKITTVDFLNTLLTTTKMAMDSITNLGTLSRRIREFGEDKKKVLFVIEAPNLPSAMEGGMMETPAPFWLMGLPATVRVALFKAVLHMYPLCREDGATDYLTTIGGLQILTSFTRENVAMEGGSNVTVAEDGDSGSGPGRFFLAPEIVDTAKLSEATREEVVDLLPSFTVEKHDDDHGLFSLTGVKQTTKPFLVFYKVGHFNVRDSGGEEMEESAPDIAAAVPVKVATTIMVAEGSKSDGGFPLAGGGGSGSDFCFVDEEKTTTMATAALGAPYVGGEGSASAHSRSKGSVGVAVVA
jgi:hypothetical protein